MSHWKLPASFQNLTNYQPKPDQAPENQAKTSILHIAHGYAQKKYIAQDESIENSVSPYAWQASGLAQGQAEQTLEAAQAMSSEMEQAILQ